MNSLIKNDDLQFITTEIEGSLNGVGEDISLSKYYDDIKYARSEEDDRLSQGVWQREIKRADWMEVQRISAEILENKTKDLQVVGWLFEAIVALDELDGISLGFEILTLFLESFWYTCFPNDTEQKIAILNWIIDNINQKLLTLKFIKNISLYDYEYAVNTNFIIKRSPTLESEIRNSAERENRMLFDAIQNNIKASDFEKITEIQNKTSKIKESIASTKETVKKILEDQNAISFSKIIENIEKIEKIVKIPQPKIEIEQNTEEIISKNLEDKEFSGKNALYNKIAEISTTLKKIESHSPVPFILDLIVSWKQMSLFQIMNDLQTGETEAHKLLKILINR
ncbi:MAG: type VI secretion system ImpA family N-terminal domain-containing protein [Holosporales bacterium]|jgi:type VI secretion system protein ImpA|nr:type VI secretion system ImpA family N-terminal domain-containing protein [Holosporales bacterium]